MTPYRRTISFTADGWTLTVTRHGRDWLVRGHFPVAAGHGGVCHGTGATLRAAMYRAGVEHVIPAAQATLDREDGIDGRPEHERQHTEGVDA